MRAARRSSASSRMFGSTNSSAVASANRPLVVPEHGFSGNRHTVFRTVWLVVNVLLLSSLLAVLWSSAWEYSTRRYLQGFSDAIVPYSSSPTQKIQSILDWMSHAPARLGQAPASLTDDRDPTDTLNYASLLRVCGTATNAFINLADSAGLTARRLLLLDAKRNTVHVVAEVLIDDRWIVVDPAFHRIFRGPDGGTLTGADLAVPAIFAAATRNIPGYDPSYVFDRAVHIRLSRLGLVGRAIRRFIEPWFATWEGSPALSLIVERESLGVTIFLIVATLLLLAIRMSLRWYGEAHLGVHPRRIRSRLRRLGRLLLEPAD